MRFTVLPILVAFLIGLGQMPALNIYQICAWNHGTVKTEPWRAKLSPASPLRRFIAAASRVREWFAELTDVPLMASEVGAVGNIKQLLQEEADTKASIRALKKEGRTIGAKAEKTADETARFTAIFAELDTHETKLGDIETALIHARRLQDDDIAEATALIEVGKNHAEDKPLSLGEFLQGVAYKAAPELAAKAGFSWQGKDNLVAAVSGASSGDAASGGVLVRNEWNLSLLGKAREVAQVLPDCDNITIGDGFDGIEAPYIDETSRATGSRWGGVQVYRAAEAASVTNKQPKLGKFELRLEDLRGLFYATDRLLRDATALQSIAEDAFSSEFAFKIDDEIVRGTGTGQCLGILNAGNKVKVSKETAQTADTVKAENVIKMFSRMPARFLSQANWYINQEILPQLMTMAVAVGTAGGQLVYMPPGGLSTAPYGTLMGRPVKPIEQAAGIGDEGDIMFLALKEYAVISKAMTSASSAHVRFIFDEMTFKWTWPIIGKPKNPAALTPFKATSATSLSPFITLEAR